MTHEFGHAYGLRHLASPFEQFFGFVMGPASSGSAFSEIERTAIQAARAGSIRAGMTRDQALAADLVLPYFGRTVVASSPGFDLGICETLGGLLRAPR